MMQPPAADPASPRVAFAHYRQNGTNEVTTLGPGAEAQTHDADLRFGDLLDVVNPLQHIPGLASIYRGLTGDEISAPARILGAALYTGPVGFVLAAADAVFAEVNGRYLGDALVAAMTPASAPEPAPPAASTLARTMTEPARLEGADALAALARDLRPLERPMSPPVTPAESASRPEPLRSPAFLQNMAKALDKYRALAQVRLTETSGPAAEMPGLSAN